MRITYVSGSFIPSAKANAVHVMKMAEAWGKTGNDVTLWAKTAKGGEQPGNMFAIFDVMDTFTLKTIRVGKGRFGAAAYAFAVAALCLRDRADVWYTRSLHFALIFGLMRRNVVYEMHGWPASSLGRWSLRVMLRCRLVSKVVMIHEQLRKDVVELEPALPESDLIVAEDAASENPMEELLTDEPQEIDSVAYTGSFLPGKGVKLVLQLAGEFPSLRFDLLGGDTKSWAALVADYSPDSNVRYWGWQNQRTTRKAQCAAGILLLPNQRRVIVDQGRVDIGSYTSPLKLFEYMAARRPILASRLPVFQSVLTEGKNCLMADPENSDEWAEKLRQLMGDRSLRRRIAVTAYQDFRNQHTWISRARRIERHLAVGRLG